LIRKREKLSKLFSTFLNKASVSLYLEKLRSKEKKTKGKTVKNLYDDAVNKKGTSEKKFANRHLVFHLLRKQGFFPTRYYDQEQKKI